MTNKQREQTSREAFVDNMAQEWRWMPENSLKRALAFDLDESEFSDPDTNVLWQAWQAATQWACS